MRGLSQRPARRTRPESFGRLITALAALAVLAAMPGAARAQTGIITTVAGTGEAGYSGDGGPAMAASLREPLGLAVDAAGDFYIATLYGNVIRKVSASTGIITTFAGTGGLGVEGEGVLATEARVAEPIAVAIGPGGDLYYSEYFRGRVRRVDAATGLVHTVAGTGTPGFNGDGIPATSAQLHHPWGIALDSAGNLYIAEEGNHRIRKVEAATGLISTYAGTGTPGYSGDGGPAAAANIDAPLGIALDAAGHLYFAEYSHCVVRRVDAATGVITTVAGTGACGYGGDGGPAAAALLDAPYDVTLDEAGNLFIVDSESHRVRVVSAATGFVATAAGNGVAGFSGDGGPATEAALDHPFSAACGPGGRLYIGDAYNLRVRLVTLGESYVITWADPAGIVYGTALSAAQLNATSSVAGTFAYSPPAGTILNAGAGQTLSVTFTPSDLATYAPAAKTVTIDVAKAAPVLTWATPEAVPPGTLLGAAQLNAAANVPGTFLYDPPAGTELTATIALHATFTPAAAANYEAASAQVTMTVAEGPVDGPPYTLTVSPVPTGGKVTGAGINCGAGGTACSVTMPAPMMIGLSATASAGYVFTGWTGDCAGAEPSQWLLLEGPRTCGATFAPPAPPTPVYRLTIAPVPAGGTVTGLGLACGTGGAACSVTFGSETTVSLTAAADAGFTFTGWGGACTGTAAATTVLVNDARTCSATFTAEGGAPPAPVDGPPYTLTISPVPAGGRVTGAGIDCGAGGTACSVTMPAPMTIGLSAEANAGYTFSGWTGDCTGASPDLWLALKGARTCGASFTSTGGTPPPPPPAPLDGPPYTLTISPIPTGGKIQGAGIDCGAGGTACSVTMPAPMTLGLQATASTGFVFASWTGDCTGTSPGTWLSLAGSRACGATFTPVR